MKDNCWKDRMSSQILLETIPEDYQEYKKYAR